jgi:hypothetical protein
LQSRDADELRLIEGSSSTRPRTNNRRLTVAGFS